MTKLFFNQVVWITGASSGIGEALAMEFFKEGAILALSARRKDKLEKVCSSLGADAHAYELDVRNKADVDRVADEIAKDLGGIDVVVANAGYGVISPFEKISEDMWRNQFDTNVFGTVWTLHSALPHILKAKGRMALISSVAGKIALRNHSAYAASKFALMGIANALYQEFYHRGVSVTNIAPGIVASEFAQVDNWGVFRKEYVDKRPPSLIYPTAKAARDILRAIYQRKREAVITGHGKVASFVATHLSGLAYWGLARSNAKAKH